MVAILHRLLIILLGGRAQPRIPVVSIVFWSLAAFSTMAGLVFFEIALESALVAPLGTVGGAVAAGGLSVLIALSLLGVNSLLGARRSRRRPPTDENRAVSLAESFVLAQAVCDKYDLGIGERGAWIALVVGVAIAVSPALQKGVRDMLGT